MIYRNEEHYADPTAGNAFRNIARQRYGPARKKRRTGGQVREERHENKGRVIGENRTGGTVPLVR